MGEPAGRRGPRATSGWSTGWRCRCCDALRRDGRRRPDAAGAEGGGRVGAVRRCRPGRPATRGPAAPRAAVGAGHRDASTGAGAERDRLVKRHGDPPQRPWIYLIVATGDIYEDIPQAQAAARAGADVIAVIRSTGQSLLDYVPEGATREGYAGTYATQENFRLMRAALDDVVEGARPLRAADQLRVRAVHAGDRRRWPGSSGWT